MGDLIVAYADTASCERDLPIPIGSNGATVPCERDLLIPIVSKIEESCVGWVERLKVSLINGANGSVFQRHHFTNRCSETQHAIYGNVAQTVSLRGDHNLTDCATKAV